MVGICHFAWSMLGRSVNKGQSISQFVQCDEYKRGRGGHGVRDEGFMITVDDWGSAAGSIPQQSTKPARHSQVVVMAARRSSHRAARRLVVQSKSRDTMTDY